ncbi:MAG: bacteriohemerythrin [bacterium]
MSKKFVWTKKYSVNVAEIDEQHKEFIRICNGLINLADSASFTEEKALIKVLRLGDYASYHLGTEEELFIKTKYPDASPHVKVHNQFRKTIKDFINQVRDKSIDTKQTIKEAADFSGNWLLNHILIIDKKYSKWFNDHGINGGK